jgi:Spy/CpxP family protein refolding chaperone
VALVAAAIFLASSAVSAAVAVADNHQQAAQSPAQGAPNRPPAGPPPGSSGLGAGWDWWFDPAVKKDLKLTDEQAGRIRDIFEKREVEVKPVWDQLNREGERLEKMTRERVADDATYAVQVSKVQFLFAEVRKSRTVMIYRMFRELQPEQYKKLQDIMERRRPSDGRGPGPR